jgi:hypothetical protein
MEFKREQGITTLPLTQASFPLVFFFYLFLAYLFSAIIPLLPPPSSSTSTL